MSTTPATPRVTPTVLVAIAVTLLAWASAFIVIRGVAPFFSGGALALGKVLGQNPRDLAQRVVDSGVLDEVAIDVEDDGTVSIATADSAAAEAAVARIRGLTEIGRAHV